MSLESQLTILAMDSFKHHCNGCKACQKGLLCDHGKVLAGVWQRCFLEEVSGVNCDEPYDPSQISLSA